MGGRGRADRKRAELRPGRSTGRGPPFGNVLAASEGRRRRRGSGRGVLLDSEKRRAGCAWCCAPWGAGRWPTLTSPTALVRGTAHLPDRATGHGTALQMIWGRRRPGDGRAGGDPGWGDRQVRHRAVAAGPRNTCSRGRVGTGQGDGAARKPVRGQRKAGRASARAALREGGKPVAGGEEAIRLERRRPAAGADGGDDPADCWSRGYRFGRSGGRAGAGGLLRRGLVATAGNRHPGRVGRRRCAAQARTRRGRLGRGAACGIAWRHAVLAGGYPAGG